MVTEGFEATLRIVVTDPVTGVTSALQSGKAARAGLVSPVRARPQELVFDFTVFAERPERSGPPRLLGSFVQGPPDRRFVYIN